MTRLFPGLLPWHFGGDPYLTHDEIDAYDGAYLDHIEAVRQRQRPQDPGG